MHDEAAPVTAPEPVPETMVPAAPSPELPEKSLPEPPRTEETKKLKSAPNRKRPHDHHIWFTDREERTVIHRAQSAGLSTGIFIRKAALENPILADPRSKELEAAVQRFTAELKFIHSELGRQGGMLKMVIKPNEGQRALDPEAWEQLIRANHEAVRIQKQTAKTMETINGYFKTHQL